MKHIIQTPVEIEIVLVNINVPLVDEDREGIPQWCPIVKGNALALLVEVDTGQIRDYGIQPEPVSITVKAVDSGTYTLWGCKGDGPLSLVAQIIENYVPNRLIPGEYGDYVELEISPSGKITNWPTKPDVSEFFGRDE